MKKENEVKLYRIVSTENTNRKKINKFKTFEQTSKEI